VDPGSVIPTEVRKNMNYRYALGVTLAAGALLVSCAVAAEGELKSGPQVGKGLGVFLPLHCNGEDEGKKVCLV
jgi:hypothetical protein